MTDEKIKQIVIATGVKNLKEYGYSQVNDTNILTDDVYSAFFSSMLNENLGISKRTDLAIKELLLEIKQPKK